MNDVDYFRFIHDLFEFNDTEAASNIHTKAKFLQLHEVQPRAIDHKRKLLVEILSFCLMPNHYHILVRERVEGGISMFMEKLSTAYVMYFNTNNEKPSEVVKKVESVGFETTVGPVDFVYKWQEKQPTKAEILELADKLTEALKDTGAIFNIDTHEAPES